MRRRPTSRARVRVASRSIVGPEPPTTVLRAHVDDFDAAFSGGASGLISNAYVAARHPEIERSGAGALTPAPTPVWFCADPFCQKRENTTELEGDPMANRAASADAVPPGVVSLLGHLKNMLRSGASNRAVFDAITAFELGCGSGWVARERTKSPVGARRWPSCARHGDTASPSTRASAGARASASACASRARGKGSMARRAEGGVRGGEERDAN